MSELWLDSLLNLQTQTGAFPSRMVASKIAAEDENCFVTAQVALLMAHWGEADLALQVRLVEPLKQASDFIEQCASTAMPGAFHFYPNAGRAEHLHSALPPDIDDTALAWMVLLKRGRRSVADAQALLPSLFAVKIVGAGRRDDAPIARRPMLRTWLCADGAHDPVDLIANINAYAALSQCGARMPEHKQWCEQINVCCAQLELSASALRAYCPYYAHPVELEIALRRALQFGAVDLVPGLHAIEQAALEQLDRDASRPPDRPLYCNAHGRPIWQSSALQLARRLNDSLNPTWTQPSLPLPQSRGSYDLHA